MTQHSLFHYVVLRPRVPLACGSHLVTAPEPLFFGLLPARQKLLLALALALRSSSPSFRVSASLPCRQEALSLDLPEKCHQGGRLSAKDITYTHRERERSSPFVRALFGSSRPLPLLSSPTRQGDTAPLYLLTQGHKLYFDYLQRRQRVHLTFALAEKYFYIPFTTVAPSTSPPYLCVGGKVLIPLAVVINLLLRQAADAQISFRQ